MPFKSSICQQTFQKRLPIDMGQTPSSCTGRTLSQCNRLGSSWTFVFLALCIHTAPCYSHVMLPRYLLAIIPLLFTFLTLSDIRDNGIDDDVFLIAPHPARFIAGIIPWIAAFNEGIQCTGSCSLLQCIVICACHADMFPVHQVYQGVGAAVCHKHFQIPMLTSCTCTVLLCQ